MGTFDLRERSLKFAVDIVRFINSIDRSKSNFVVFNQVMRSGTSVGANIEEADSSPTRKDFKYKMTIAKKEAAETIYWLKIIKESGLVDDGKRIAALSDECDQLVKILSTIIRKIND
jgi:four helix bundle protein